MISVLGKSKLGTWELGVPVGAGAASFIATAGAPQLGLTTIGGTPERTFCAVPGWSILGRVELGQTRPDLAGLAGTRGHGNFVGTAEPTASFTGAVFNVGAFEATADPLCSFNRGGAFVGTADPRAAFEGSTAPVVKAVFTADPLLSFSPIVGQDEGCVTASQAEGEGEASPNYVY